MKKKLQSGLFISVLTLFLLSAATTYAQSLPCGNIISPGDVSDLDLGIEDDVIEDCNDPFGVTIDPPNPYTVQINGEDIAPGATVVLPGGRTNDVSFSGTPGLSTVNTGIFKHVGNNYEYVSREAGEPTEADYRAFAETYFSTQAERDLYIEITLYNFENTNLDFYFIDSETGEDIIDEETGETVQSRYNNFIEAVYENFDDSAPYLEAGTYTMLFYEYQLEVTQRSIWDSIRDFIIPTAYAQCQQCIPDRFYTITFTIIETPPEPTGASSILFLPGIMGSRLYEESDACDDEGVIEQERWFSTNECEQLRLKTDFTGQPLHSLYTKPTTESVIDNIFFVSPLYNDFLERLAEEKDNETIADYRAVPYDWRLKLGDILKTKKVNEKIVFDSLSTYQQSYLYTSLQELVSTSDSGKVTIVAHSNGGLLAKTLILEMQANNDPLLSKIDNLILVAVPQTGTPDAVIGMLQGTEIFGGIVIDEVVSRDILNTAPFGHHLLPSAGYFSGSGTTVDTPVLQFLQGGVSGIWRNEYGEGITSLDNLHRFLSKDSNRYNPERADLSQPEVVDNFLLDYSEVVHAGQSSFTPPPSMKVSQVAGIGISTPAIVTYFTDKECVNRSIFSFFTCTEYRDKLGYSVRMVADGDGTVVIPSALAMSETDRVERFWVDLFDHSDNESNRVHRNILEVVDIQNFILNTVQATTSRSYTYLEQEEIIPEVKPRLVFQLHSPLDMWVSTDSGVVSSSTTEVIGALYKRVGDVQYIEVPNTAEDIELHMLGQATGSFTLEIEHWLGSELEQRVDYVAVPTATSTIVTASVADNIAETLLELDLEGDGQIEAEMTGDGELLLTEVTYSELISAVDSSNLSRARKQALLTLIKSAEYYGTRVPMKKTYLVLEELLLRTSEELVRLYVKKRFITVSDGENILEMIKFLKNKQ